MSIETPTPAELQMADQISKMLEENEKFSSPGLDSNETAQAKVKEVLDLHRLAISDGPGFAGDGEWLWTQAKPSVAVPGVDDNVAPQVFTTRNPAHLLAPIIVPAWNPGCPIVVRNGATVREVLAGRALPEDTGLDMSRCYWHEGPGQGGKRSRHPKLLTQTCGQYVVVWWVCPHCAEHLKAALGEIRTFSGNVWVDKPYMRP